MDPLEFRRALGLPVAADNKPAARSAAAVAAAAASTTKSGTMTALDLEPTLAFQPQRELLRTPQRADGGRAPGVPPAALQSSRHPLAANVSAAQQPHQHQVEPSPPVPAVRRRMLEQQQRASGLATPGGAATQTLTAVVAQPAAPQPTTLTAMALPQRSSAATSNDTGYAPSPPVPAVLARMRAAGLVPAQAAAAAAAAQPDATSSVTVDNTSRFIAAGMAAPEPTTRPAATDRPTRPTPSAGLPPSTPTAAATAFSAGGSLETEAPTPVVPVRAPGEKTARTPVRRVRRGTAGVDLNVTFHESTMRQLPLPDAVPGNGGSGAESAATMALPLPPVSGEPTTTMTGLTNMTLGVEFDGYTMDTMMLRELDSER